MNGDHKTMTDAQLTECPPDTPAPFSLGEVPAAVQAHLDAVIAARLEKIRVECEERAAAAAEKWSSLLVAARHALGGLHDLLAGYLPAEQPANWIGSDGGRYNLRLCVPGLCPIEMSMSSQGTAWLRTGNWTVVTSEDYGTTIHQESSLEDALIVAHDRAEEYKPRTVTADEHDTDLPF